MGSGLEDVAKWEKMLVWSTWLKGRPFANQEKQRIDPRYEGAFCRAASIYDESFGMYLRLI